MNIRLTLNGRTPLLMHNPQLVDPDNTIVREIKALTTKRKKTDEDLKAIEKLEWYGGLYTANGTGPTHVVQPTSKVRKCLINTAKISKASKMVERALSFDSLYVPLVYKGPSDIDKLFQDKNFHSRLSVAVRGNRVMRVRPQFLPPWSLVLTGVFIEDAGLNFEDFVRIVELAGTVEGIGDARVIGYGRFEGKVEEVR